MHCKFTQIIISLTIVKGQCLPYCSASRVKSVQLTGKTETPLGLSFVFVVKSWEFYKHFRSAKKTERELALSPFRNRDPKDTTYYSLQNKNNAEPETNQVQHQTNQGLKKISQSFRCGTWTGTFFSCQYQRSDNQLSQSIVTPLNLFVFSPIVCLFNCYYAQHTAGYEQQGYPQHNIAVVRSNTAHSANDINIANIRLCNLAFIVIPP